MVCRVKNRYSFISRKKNQKFHWPFPIAVDSRNWFSTNIFQMLCNQQQSELWYVAVATPEFGQHRLGRTANVLHANKCWCRSFISGSKAAKFNDVPIVAKAWIQSGATQWCLLWSFERMVSSTLSTVFGCRTCDCYRWILRTREHCVQLHTNDGEAQTEKSGLSNNRNNDAIECTRALC